MSLDTVTLRRHLQQALGKEFTVGDLLGEGGFAAVLRDVKPDNILLDTSGHVLVADFGIAKAAQEASGTSQLTTEGMVVGTPQYMSPEQATGDAVDARSDIYGLGVVLYQMLAGSPPFDGESAQSILMKQATATPVPIRQLRSDVPPALAAVIERLLAKDPAERFQTAEQVSRALVEALPAAAGERVRVRGSAVAIRSLVGVGVVGCLAFASFVAGAVVVSWTLFSGPPRLDAGAPVPASVGTPLRPRA